MERGEDATKTHSGFSGSYKHPGRLGAPIKASRAEESESLRAFKCI